MALCSGLDADAVLPSTSEDESLHVGAVGLHVGGLGRRCLEDSGESAQAAAACGAAFGTIAFGGGVTPGASQFACVAPTTTPSQLTRLLTHCWRLQRPSMIISVVGADETESLDLSPALERACADGFAVIAQHSNAWVLTNGFDSGAAALVGQGIRALGSRASHQVAVRSACIAVTPLPRVLHHERFLPDLRLDVAGTRSPRTIDSWPLYAFADKQGALLRPPRCDGACVRALTARVVILASAAAYARASSYFVSRLGCTV